MSAYTLDDIKNLLKKGDYDELNKIINSMRDSSKEKTREDVEILEYLSGSDLISDDSKYQLDKLKNEIENQIIEKVESKEEIINEQIENTIEDKEVIDSINNPISESIETFEPTINEELINSSNSSSLIEEQEEIKLENNEEINSTIETEESIDYETSSIENKKVVEENYSTAYNEYFNKFTELGLTIKDFSNKDGVPRISFEINNFSKEYLDNLMLQLYNNPKNGLGFDMTKLGTTKEELFTIYMNDPSQSLEDVEKKTSDLLNKVEDIVLSTKNDKNYEEMMPDNLKNLKEQFTNDAPDIPQNENYRIGYLNTEGTDNFYLMAGSKNQAIRLTEEMGFTPRKYAGNGVVEIDTDGKNMNGTKLEQASENINNMDTNQAYTPIVNEKAKQKTLGTYPTVTPNTDNGFSNFKTVCLVIFLILVVMVVVFFMQ